MNKRLQEIPPVHALQKHPRFESIVEHHKIPVKKLTEWLQVEIAKLRESLLINDWIERKPSRESFEDFLLSSLENRAEHFSQSHLQRVINGTGVVLHTNLGRARLSDEAVGQVEKIAGNYSTLEFNLEKGERGSRHDIVESLLCEITGAEAAMVVNNNAAAVFLVLRALANQKEVIVSRGQLVEIGGSFRISSIMKESGAHLVEVGTTNKTHVYDYENAVSEETAMLMKVHTSNFKVTGFTESVPTESLKMLATKNGFIFYEDLGSGAFYDFKINGIGEEPIVSEMIGMGVDLVTCSGDKLLGGPQAGIVAGKKQWIDRLKKHQLARVLRVDKMTLAALETTLKTYIRGGDSLLSIPTLRDVLTKPKDIKARAETFIDIMQSTCPSFQCRLVEDQSQIGGGTMPDVFLPTYGVLIVHPEIKPQALADRFRTGKPPVVIRMKDEQVFIDFRTITDDEVNECIKTIKHFL